MSNNQVTIRQLAQHLSNQPTTAFSIRQILNHETGQLHIETKPAPFTLMTQNMGLLVAPATYLGTDRGGAILEIIARIKALTPDVVGLCEVFADDERALLRVSLNSLYPYFHEGPDEADLDSDGGLLLLSKHPILQQHQIVYKATVGGDWWANKGALHIRVQPAAAPMPYDIFYSHTQNIAEDGGQAALYAQLTHLHTMIVAYADANMPTIIMGDLNIPGEIPAHYQQLLTRLGHPIDFWTVAGNTAANGFTFAADNNFYADDDDNPHQNQRLDYILMKAGARFVPLLNKMEILKFIHNGRFISDHFGLYAQIEQFVQINV